MQMHQYGGSRMRGRGLRGAFCAALWLGGAGAIAGLATVPPVMAAGLQVAAEINPPAQAADWAALAKLPDWSGTWVPNVRDQTQQQSSNPPPWNAKVGKEMAQAEAEEKAGKPRGLFANCVPEGLPSGMLVNHVAMEILVTPGRVTIFGDGDGNKLRRIYTDGRAHTSDPNPTLYGESIGRWEGDTLVVDTIGILPQSILAINQAIGVPNDGDMRVVERIRLAAPDTLHDELTITAPKILTKPWKTTRIFARDRRRVAEIKEAVCIQGTLLTEGTDKDGHASWAPAAYDFEGGTPVPTEQK
jgi:hypothetical protein